MKTHRPWQPRMRSGSLFNPFVPPTEAPYDADRIEISEEEEEAPGTMPEAAAAQNREPEGSKDR